VGYGPNINSELLKDKRVRLDVNILQSYRCKILIRNCGEGNLKASKIAKE